jgi:hypothetical protein
MGYDESTIIDGGRMNEEAGAPLTRGGHVIAMRNNGAPTMWRRLDGVLVYDSRDRPPDAGVRTGAAGRSRLLFRAGGFEVDLQIGPGSTTGYLRLLGQVLNDAFEPCSGWVVVEKDGSTVKAALDGCGHFAIDGLVPGRYRIEAGLPNALIVLPPVHV